MLATYQVTTSDDIISSGCDAQHCTLRDAVLMANSQPGQDTITFSPSIRGATINLRTPLRLSESVSIQGPGANDLVLSGLGTHQVFQIGGGGSNLFEIKDLTVAYGRSGTELGGAISFGLPRYDTDEADRLTLHGLIVRDNKAPGGAGVYVHGGTLNVTNTSFVNNQVFNAVGTTQITNGQGAAILQVGGNGALVNTTFAKQIGPYQGGTVALVGLKNATKLEIVNSTFAGNGNRALMVIADGAPAQASVQTSLFSENASGTLAVRSSSTASATLVSLGHNLSSDFAGGLLDAISDRLQTNALLGPLDAATQTFSPRPGSPAIDSGVAPGGSLPTTDQRGRSREAGAGVDIGAIEVAYDFGDAPPQSSAQYQSNYPTLAADAGAYHVVGGPRLGASVDSERDGQPSGMSLGDASGIDDEDGVVFIGGRYQALGEALTIAIDLQNPASTQNLLDAWIDWGRDGSWLDEGDQIASSINLGTVAGVTILEVPLPTDYQAGPAHMRFRVSTTGHLQPTGGAADGEVEDYTVVFMPQDFVPVVDNVLDELDGDLTPGDVSLREAIEYVNTVGGATTITIDPSLAGEVIELSAGPLQPRRSMTLAGPNGGSLTIDAQGKSRIFEIDQTNIDLALSDLELTGGATDTQQDGGAIWFDSQGSLTALRCVLSDNASDGRGGAVASQGGQVTLIDTEVSGNQSALDGGGIWIGEQGKLTLLRSQVSDNHADENGGGIAASDSALSALHSTIARNTALLDAGGVWLANLLNSGNASEIVGSTVSGNQAMRNGGALYINGGLVTITASTVVRNHANYEGGGISAATTIASRTRMESNIVAENTIGLSNQNQIASNITAIGPSGLLAQFESNGYNVFGPASDTASSATGNDLVNVIQAGLAPLATYGGTIEVHPLMSTSVALDAGRNVPRLDTYDLNRDGITAQWVSVDVRGVRRSIDLTKVVNRADGTDAGAVEMIGISVADAIASESQGEIQFTASLTDPLPEGRQVSTVIEATYLSAVPGIDFVSPRSTPISMFDAGDLTDTFSIELIDDARIEANEKFLVSLSPADGWTVRDGRAQGTIISDDVAGLVLSKSQLTASESGRSDALDLTLAAQPDGVVVIDVAIDRDDEAQLDRSEMVFNSVNWNVPQRLVVSAKNDQYIDGSQTSQITLSVREGADAPFASLADVVVPVVTTDNDVAGITVRPLGALTTTETGGQASFVVRLDALPEADVTIGLQTSNPNEAVIDRQTLVFTPENGTSEQTVTVTGVDDDWVDGNVMLTIIIDPASSEDPNFDGLNAADVIVRNLDDEQMDFGDAPAQYPTLLANDGARHVHSSLFLGTQWDFEPDGSANQQADGDGMDDDGVQPLTSLVVSESQDTSASLLVHASASGLLDAWVDFNRDGDWNDPGEQISVGLRLTAGDNVVPVRLPAGTQPGETFARFRISSDGGLSPSGPAADGEVEDYRWELLSGQAGQRISVRPPSGNATIQRIGQQVVVSSGAIELFRGTLASGTIIECIGSGGDDLFQIDDVNASGIAIVISGGAGRDVIELLQAQTQDNWLASASGNQFYSIEVVDLQAVPQDKLQIDPETITEVTDSSASLDVLVSSSDQLTHQSAWRLVGAANDQQAYQIWQAGDVKLRVATNHPWTNGLSPMDVNASGLVSALDALIILNSLASGIYHDPNTGQLVDPTTIDPPANLYLDTNADGRLSPLDALVVLNALRVSSLSGEWSNDQQETDLQTNDEQANAIESAGFWATDFWATDPKKRKS